MKWPNAGRIERQGRPVVCVSHWTRHNGQTTIVLAHELAHVAEVYNAENKEHNHAHYQTTGRILSRILNTAEVSAQDKIRLRIYYQAGRVIAPFTDAF